jgi:murein DD-endopeptidase MepM/ murein hydrolase activator NlpD
MTLRVHCGGWPLLRVGLVALVLLAPAAVCRGSETVAVDVSARARAIAPGEPIRIVVDSPTPLASVSAKFLDQEVFFVREQSVAGRTDERWSGWALIGLLEDSGEAVLQVSGLTQDDRAAAGTLALRVEEREFPVERLSVSQKYVEPPPEVKKRLEEERTVLAAIYVSRTPVLPGAASFVRPVDGEPTSVFGTRRLFNDEPRSPHPGIDLRAGTGTPVSCSGPGRVVLARDLYYSGGTVIVDHGAGLFTLYAHLSRIEAVEGETIRAGDIVGLSGATGRVTGPHLHWGAKIGNEPFDPRALLDPTLFD